MGRVLMQRYSDLLFNPPSYPNVLYPHLISTLYTPKAIGPVYIFWPIESYHLRVGPLPRSRAMNKLWVEQRGEMGWRGQEGGIRSLESLNLWMPSSCGTLREICSGAIQVLRECCIRSQDDVELRWIILSYHSWIITKPINFYLFIPSYTIKMYL